MQMKDKKLWDLIHAYLLVYLPKQKCYSPNTIKSYRESLELLLDYACGTHGVTLSNITFELIGAKTVLGFLSWLENERRCSDKTINHRLTGVRSFFNYAGDMELTAVKYQQEILKVPMRKTPESLIVDFMSEDAVAAILSQPNTKSRKGVRDLFFMLLMYDTAARDRELLDLRIKDVYIKKKEAYVYLTGKGGKIRSVPIMEKTVEHFKGYVGLFHENEQGTDNPYLFYTVRNRSKNQMSDDNTAKFIKQYATQAKKVCAEVPENVHPHLFRHARAMHLYRSGMPLALLSEWLGHANLETTLIYAYADTEMKRVAIETATSDVNVLRSEKEAPKAFWQNDNDLIKRLYGFR